MTRPKVGKINIGVYETTVHVIVVDNDEGVIPYAMKVMKKHKSTLEADMADSICSGFAILMEKDPLDGYLIYSKTSLSVNVITHETDHMRKYILDFKDIEDHEASANLNGFINQEVFSMLKKWGFEIK